MSSNFGFGSSKISETSVKNVEASTPWVAASDGDLELVKKSLKTLNMFPSVSDENGYTLVHAAAAYNQISILEWLSQQNMNVNAQDNDGDSPLHHVEKKGTAQFLVEKMNANPNLRNAKNKTALQEKMEEIKMDDGDDDDEADAKELITYLESLNE